MRTRLTRTSLFSPMLLALLFVAGGNAFGQLSPERAGELVAFDEALKELAELSQRQSRVVELRYFGGLSVEETATVLKVSPDTVMRDWNMAKTWLHRALQPAGDA